MGAVRDKRTFKAGKYVLLAKKYTLEDGEEFVRGDTVDFDEKDATRLGRADAITDPESDAGRQARMEHTEDPEERLRLQAEQLEDRADALLAKAAALRGDEEPATVKKETSKKSAKKDESNQG